MVRFPSALMRHRSTFIMYLSIGAFFGTTFAHLFFQSYREMMPAPFYKPSASSPRSGSTSNAPSPPFTNPNPYGGQKRAAGKIYTPKIYGFKVSERAKCGPRMQWMRLRPQDPAELDMVDWRGRWYEDEDDEEYEDSEDGGEDRPMEDFDVRTRRPVSHARGAHPRSSYRIAEIPKTTTRKRRRRKRRKAVDTPSLVTASSARRPRRLPRRARHHARRAMRSARSTAPDSHRSRSPARQRLA